MISIRACHARWELSRRVPISPYVDAGAAVVGLNCSRGPATMMPLLERIRAAVDIPIAAQPVPYRTDAAAPAFESLTYPNGRRAFRSNSSRSRTPASRWPTSPVRQLISVSGTSGSAAAAHHTTCGRWQRHSAAKHLPVATRLRWTCIRCWGRCRTPRRRP